MFQSQNHVPDGAEVVEVVFCAPSEVGWRRPLGYSAAAPILRSAGGHQRTRWRI